MNLQVTLTVSRCKLRCPLKTPVPGVRSSGFRCISLFLPCFLPLQLTFCLLFLFVLSLSLYLSLSLSLSMSLSLSLLLAGSHFKSLSDNWGCRLCHMLWRWPSPGYLAVATLMVLKLECGLVRSRWCLGLGFRIKGFGFFGSPQEATPP